MNQFGMNQPFGMGNLNTGFGGAPSGLPQQQPNANLLGFNAPSTTNTGANLGGLGGLTDLGGLDGLGSLGGSNVAAAPSSSDSVVIKAAEDSNLDVSFHCKKVYCMCKKMVLLVIG